MKPMVRLVALVLVALASFTTLPSAAKARALAPKPCADFCAIVFCAGSQTCGPTPTGCACHD